MPAPNITAPRCNIQVVGNAGNVPAAQQQLNRYDTYLAADPVNPDHMVGICRKFVGDGVNYQDVLEAQYTFDGGLSWGTSQLPLDTNTYYTISDPWVGIGVNAAGQSVVYAIGLGCVTSSGSTQGSQQNAKAAGSAVLAYQSQDGGITWAQPVTIVSDGDCDNTFGAVDTISGFVYAIWNDNQYTSTDAVLAFAASTDGTNWVPSTYTSATQNSRFDLNISSGFNYVNMAVGPDGVIHIVGANGQGNPALLSYARSIDHGQSFEYGTIATSVGPADIDQIALGPDSSGSDIFPNMEVINPPAIVAVTGGQVFVAWTVDLNGYSAIPPLMRLGFASSADNGESWIQNATNKVVPPALTQMPLGALPQSQNDHYFRPRLAAAGDGTIGCSFSYCAVSASNSSIPPQLGTCLLVTDSFVPQQPRPVPSPTVPYFDALSCATALVSDQLTNPISSVSPVFRFGVPPYYFVGDFIGLAANTSGYFPFWSDTRNGAALPIMSRVAVNPCNTYIRHFLADQGDLSQPPAGQTLFDAPDLVIRLQPDGNQTFVDQTIPPTPQDLYLYGRVFNAGPAPARNAQLFAVTGAYISTTEWFYPYDWCFLDWSVFGINATTHTNFGSAPAVNPIATGTSEIIGPIIIPATSWVVWPGSPANPLSHPCILARIHVDNDDGQGGVPSGCALYAGEGPGGMQSFFWQSNKVCQKNLTQTSGTPGVTIKLPLLIGNQLSRAPRYNITVQWLEGDFSRLPVHLRRLPGIPRLPGSSQPPVASSGNPSRRPPSIPSVLEEWTMTGPASKATIDRRNESIVALELAVRLPETAKKGQAGRLRIIQTYESGLIVGASDFTFTVAAR